ncbi:hypothetical protein PHYSODRAFT_323075 [Phytophthora sojae]|uniref:FAD-binding PCMH-type domain-containing protein n=1 Tax=Phytophthora sojae (strain P6497) TaxID=1094619 RepID=G4YQ57_PHYSP|nr:hypothetical protein PHYSODRAFT_323075 [Phytophthora sojae]EGZ29561.1 hypothetical protein PHYSODRAFT_323075 [Phytophthora sojae]|eukprot:XP_009516836.1 hypothetical protein PHYSODRAFT_323075 [Phytophthora sojae]
MVASFASVGLALCSLIAAQSGQYRELGAHHSMGFGRNDGTLIINLKNMKVLKYDESTKLLTSSTSVLSSTSLRLLTLTYGDPVIASLMWNDHKRTLPHGRCADVGMTGIASSGFATLSRHRGTVLDNIVGVRVALANGSIVDADAEHNSHLFWGVRGAASSMGVVLQFKMTTLEPPSQRVTNYTILVYVMTIVKVQRATRSNCSQGSECQDASKDQQSFKERRPSSKDYNRNRIEDGRRKEEAEGSRITCEHLGLATCKALCVSDIAAADSDKVRTVAAEGQIAYSITFNETYTPTQQDNVDALLGTQKWALSKDNDDRLSIRYFFKTNTYMSGFFYGSTDEATAVLGSLMKNLPPSMVLKKNEFDFWASEEITTAGISTKGMSPRRNDVPLDNSTAWALYSNTAYAPKLPDSTASGFIDVWGGEFTKTIKGDTSAWKHDNNLLLVRYDLRSKAYNITFADNSITTMRGNFYKFVDAYKAAGGTPGALITYRDERWTIDETAKILYGGGNFERL